MGFPLPHQSQGGNWHNMQLYLVSIQIAAADSRAAKTYRPGVNFWKMQCSLGAILLFSVKKFGFLAFIYKRLL